MHYRLLDFLACPHDRHFPLSLEVQKDVKTVQAPKTTCVSYCGFEQKNIDAINLSSCQDCQRIKVIQGSLFCPHCGSEFKIKYGLPRLLPDYQRFFTDQRVVKLKQNERQSRDEQAFAYDQLFFLKALSRLEIPAVLSLLQPDEEQTILELGAGTGRLTQLIAQKAEVIAVDHSVNSLRLSAVRTPAHSVHFVLADINHLPFRSSAFTKAVSCQVFEHIPTAVRQQALNEVHRVLKDKGSFTLTVYRDSWLWRLFGPKEGFHPGGIYYYRFAPQELKEWLSSSFQLERFIANLGLYLLAAKVKKV